MCILNCVLKLSIWNKTKLDFIIVLFTVRMLAFANRFYCREKHFFRSNSDFCLQVCVHSKVGKWFVYTVTITATWKHLKGKNKTHSILPQTVWENYQLFSLQNFFAPFSAVLIVVFNIRALTPDIFIKNTGQRFLVLS